MLSPFVWAPAIRKRKKAVNIKLKSWSALAILVILLGFASGCIGVTQAASGDQGNVGQQTRNENLLAPPAEPVAQENARLYFEPSPGQTTVGNVAAVRLRLENVQNLYGLEVHLTFDASVVQIEDDDPSRAGVQIALGEIPHPEFIVQNMVDNNGGRVDYAVVQLSPRPPASGSGVVATLHFRGLREGSSPIRFIGAKLASPEGLEIPVTLQEGSIVVGPIPDDTPTPTGTSGAPTASPSVTPTHTPQGPTASPDATPTNTPQGPTSTATATQTPQAPTSTSQPPTAAPPSSTPTPAGSPAPTVTLPDMSGCPTLYVVRTGDTAFSIARRFGVSLGALASANGLPSSYYIQIGQLLVIPGVPGPTADTHVVQKGETLYSIARRYGASVETLAAINRLPHPWHVRTGQTLLICKR
jgi:LysM repeat protein